MAAVTEESRNTQYKQQRSRVHALLQKTSELTCVSHFASLDKKHSHSRSQKEVSFDLSQRFTASVAMSFHLTYEDNEAVLCGKNVNRSIIARKETGERVSASGWRSKSQISVAADAVKQVRACRNTNYSIFVTCPFQHVRLHGMHKSKLLIFGDQHRL